MKCLLLSSLALLFIETVQAEAVRLPCGQTNCSTFRLDIRKQRLELMDTDDSGKRFRNAKGLEAWGRSRNLRLIFATNAGIFSPELKPLGLFIKEGKLVVPMNRADGRGNFYLKPSGVFFIDTKRADVVATTKYYTSPTVRIASQSGPLLLNDGKMHPEFRKDSENLTTRSGVGVASDTDVVFAISEGPINFYDFASFFEKSLDCKSALYLDGAISKMYLPELDMLEREGDFAAMFAVFEKADN